MIFFLGKNRIFFFGKNMIFFFGKNRIFFYGKNKRGVGHRFGNGPEETSYWTYFIPVGLRR